jgi:hypothetical protein
MNVQDVINAALEQARGSSSSSAIAEQRDSGSCANADVTKLAAALNFIGTHLEDDAQKTAASAYALPASAAMGALSGYMGAKRRDKILREGGVDMITAEAMGLRGPKRSALRGAAGGLLGGALGDITDQIVTHDEIQRNPAAGLSRKNLDKLQDDGSYVASNASVLTGGGLASALNYLGHTRRARKIVRKAHKLRERAERRKAADNLPNEKSAQLQYAAHAGKAALIEKLAEDRINPAKIVAGPADAFSGEVMPASSPVFGGGTSIDQLISMKAQKVRDRVNSDMRSYVSNTGDGYNLSGYLSTFNK